MSSEETSLIGVVTSVRLNVERWCVCVWYGDGACLSGGATPKKEEGALQAASGGLLGGERKQERAVRSTPAAGREEPDRRDT